MRPKIGVETVARDRNEFTKAVIFMWDCVEGIRCLPEFFNVAFKIPVPVDLFADRRKASVVVRKRVSEMIVKPATTFDGIYRYIVDLNNRISIADATCVCTLIALSLSSRREKTFIESYFILQID